MLYQLVWKHESRRLKTHSAQFCKSCWLFLFVTSNSVVWSESKKTRTSKLKDSLEIALVMSLLFQDHTVNGRAKTGTLSLHSSSQPRFLLFLISFSLFFIKEVALPPQHWPLPRSFAGYGQFPEYPHREADHSVSTNLYQGNR